MKNSHQSENVVCQTCVIPNSGNSWYLGMNRCSQYLLIFKFLKDKELQGCDTMVTYSFKFNKLEREHAMNYGLEQLKYRRAMQLKFSILTFKTLKIGHFYGTFLHFE